jgi:segregation and condensation protein B
MQHFRSQPGVGWAQRARPWGAARAIPPAHLPNGPARRRLLISRPAVGATEPKSPHARDSRVARLEAVLFASTEALTSRKLARHASLADGTEARTLVRRLNRLYDAEGRAFRVEEVAGGLRLMTRAKFGPWLRKLHQAAVETRISAPALETLAVVAYRQPVVRAEIEAVRGVQCGEMLRQLMERDLVRIAGRTEDLGRPFLYGTTRRFLQVFGLRDLEELPRAELLRSKEPQKRSEEFPVKRVVPTDLAAEELLAAHPSAAVEDDRPHRLALADDDEDEDWDDDEDDDDEDEDEDEDDDMDDDFDDDDLEDDEWEEVDDDDEDDLDDDEDEDDDWDDDEDDEEEDEEEEDDED